MLMHSIKMTIHLLRKRKKEKEKKEMTIHLPLSTNLLNCYPYNMSYYLHLQLFTSFHPKLEFGRKTVSL